jgi:hypothetical protein
MMGCFLLSTIPSEISGFVRVNSSVDLMEMNPTRKPTSRSHGYMCSFTPTHLTKCNEPNNTKDETHIEPVDDTPVKIVYDSKRNNDYFTDYELREDSSYSIKIEHGEPFYGTDSKCP